MGGTGADSTSRDDKVAAALQGYLRSHAIRQFESRAQNANRTACGSPHGPVALSPEGMTRADRESWCVGKRDARASSSTASVMREIQIARVSCAVVSRLSPALAASTPGLAIPPTLTTGTWGPAGAESFVTVADPSDPVAGQAKVRRKAARAPSLPGVHPFAEM
jgi:hypothetical protein